MNQDMFKLELTEYELLEITGWFGDLLERDNVGHTEAMRTLYEKAVDAMEEN